MSLGPHRLDSIAFYTGSSARPCRTCAIGLARKDISIPKDFRHPYSSTSKPYPLGKFLFIPLKCAHSPHLSMSPRWINLALHMR